MLKYILNIVIIVIYFSNANAQFAYVDSSYLITNGPNDRVVKIALQDDGKLIAIGYFTHFSDTPMKYICRLNIDGSLDTTFNPQAGPDGYLFDLALNDEGKIIVVGNFTYFNGIKCDRIARLNTDGSVDVEFSTKSSANSRVYNCALDPNGKILIGGNFSNINLIPKRRLARLHEDGALDLSFDCGGGPKTNNNFAGDINQVLVDDSLYYVVGEFDFFNEIPRRNIVCLSSSGGVIENMNFEGGTNDEISCITRHTDSSILIGGYFDSIGNYSYSGLAKLFNNGNIDTVFNIGTGKNTAGVYDIGVFNDSLILINGGYGHFDGNYGSVQVLNSKGDVISTYSVEEISGVINDIEKGKCDVFYFGGTFDGLDPSNSQGVNTDKIGRIRFELNIDTITFELFNCHSAIVGLDTFTESGIYKYDEIDQTGCKTAYYVEIVIPIIDTSIISDEGTLYASEGYNLYEWIDCSSGEIVFTSSENYFKPNENGTYLAIISYGECKDTTSCIQQTVSSNNLAKLEEANRIFTVSARTIFLNGMNDYESATIVSNDGISFLIPQNENTFTIPASLSGIIYVCFNGNNFNTIFWPIYIMN
jgi:uncharacterized delta-60 repeat protein